MTIKSFLGLLLLFLLTGGLVFFLSGCASPFAQEYEDLNAALKKGEISYIDYLQAWYDVRRREFIYYWQKALEWFRQRWPIRFGPRLKTSLNPLGAGGQRLACSAYLALYN